jgi:methionyl-tRNA formyltransferase
MIHNTDFKFVFFGSPRYAEIVLEALIKNGYVPELVVCNPDRLVGRKRVLTAPETKVLAEKHNIAVFQPESLRGDINWAINWADIDFSIVAVYGQIIPEEIIELPRLGTLGLHPSWLPKYRGPSPIKSVILAGERWTAATIYQMDKGMDSGPTLWGKPIEIKEGENAEDLGERLWQEEADGLLSILPDFLAGKLEARPQNHELATYTKMFETKDGEVDMQKDSPEQIYRKILALYEEPGVYTFNFTGREGKRVKLLEASMNDDELKVTRIHEAGKNPIDIS